VRFKHKFAREALLDERGAPVFEHQCAPDRSRTSEVQRWLQEKLSISRFGCNSPRPGCFRLHLLLIQSLNLHPHSTAIFANPPTSANNLPSIRVGNGNLAVYDLEVEMVRDEDSFVPRIFVGPHPGEGLIEVFLQFEVEDDAADFPARVLDVFCDLLIQPVEIGIVPGFLGFDKAVIGGLPMGDELSSLQKPEAILD
jgi:hypothetical protein